MAYTVLGNAQVATATVNTGTSTFSSCITNTFLVQNTTAQAAWVNVYSGTTTPSSFHHATALAPAAALYVPANGSQVVAGNFDVTGGGQTVIVNSITAASSATLIITPVELNFYQSSI